jgi:four helix bundle protein
MSPIRTLRDLRVWQEAFALGCDTDRIAALLPPPVRAALADQIRRAGQSIHSNIAEGHRRPSDRDFARYLVMARGSLHEVESNMVLLRAESLVPAEDVIRIEVRIARVERLLAGLLRFLEPPPT